MSWFMGTGCRSRAPDCTAGETPAHLIPRRRAATPPPLAVTPKLALPWQERSQPNILELTPDRGSAKGSLRHGEKGNPRPHREIRRSVPHHKRQAFPTEEL